MTTITISGLPGTGTTTIAKLLKKELGLEYIYSGDIFRNMAEKYNMSLEEFGSYCEKHRDIDEDLDRYQLEILQSLSIMIMIQLLVMGKIQLVFGMKITRQCGILEEEV